MITIYDQNVWNYSPSSYRNKLIRSLVDDFDPDICTFQECGPAIRSAEISLPSLMEDVYAEVCGELADKNYTPIYYKKDIFDILASGYVLYDGLNDVNSKSITWAIFKEKNAMIQFAVISTHFWWMQESERDNQQRLKNVDQLSELCNVIIEKYDVPIIIAGDLNCGKNSKQGEKPYEYMLQKGFSDIRLIADETTNEFTWHDYPVLSKNKVYEKGTMPIQNLDYIFTYGNYPVKTKKFKIITTQKALDSSDHCPLIGVFDM